MLLAFCRVPHAAVEILYGKLYVFPQQATGLRVPNARNRLVGVLAPGP